MRPQTAADGQTASKLQVNTSLHAQDEQQVAAQSDQDLAGCRVLSCEGGLCRASNLIRQKWPQTGQRRMMRISYTM
jgi:hypothetical protein